MLYLVVLERIVFSWSNSGKNKYTKKIVKDIITSNDKIIHMGGDFQKEFTHEIPKVKTSDSLDTTRYSITFRKHKN